MNPAKVLFITSSPNVRARLLFPTLQDVDILPFLMLDGVQYSRLYSRMHEIMLISISI